MELQQIKYYPCPWHLEQGILIVDLETETIPQTDIDGNRLYYCPDRQHIFSAKRGYQITVSLDAQKHHVL